MKCKQTVYHQNKVEKSEFKPIAVIFFLCITKFSNFQNNRTGIIILIKIYTWSACILFLNEDVPVKKAKM